MAKAKKVEKRAPQAEMLELIVGYWGSQLVRVAVELGIPDLLAKAPLTAAALAKKVRVHPGFLARVLRALASIGVLRETSGGRFRLTAKGATLRGDAPGSLKDFARMIVDDYNWQPWARLPEAVRTGSLAFDRVHGQPIFEYLRDHPEQERVFAASMASISGVENPAIARAYDFSAFGTLVDVGGAHGHLLAEILRRHRRLRGVLFDQPQVVARAKASGFLAAPAIARRCEIVPGSFFEGVPAGADAYIMKYILHDWDDARSLAILRHCRAAMAPKGRVLIVENVIEPGNDPTWGKLLDINMMVLTGGLERTRDEFRALLGKAGLKLRRIVPTAAPVSIVEASAA